MTVHVQKATALLHRFNREAEKAQKAAMRARQLRPDIGLAEVQAIAEERNAAHTEAMKQMRQLVSDAREYAAIESPMSIERNMTSSTAERTAKANSVRQMLEGAPLSELLAEAKAAAARYDTAALRGIRLALLARQAKPEEAAPIIAALNAPHAERAQQAREEAFEVQKLAARLETGGPFALYHWANTLKPVASMALNWSANHVEIEGEKFTVPADKLREIEERHARDFQRAEVPDAEATALIETATRVANGTALAARIDRNEAAA